MLTVFACLQLAEAVGQVQAGIKGLLQQGWRAAGPGQQGLAPIQTALAGKPVASRTPTKAAKAGDAYSPHDRIRYPQHPCFLMFFMSASSYS